MANTGTNTKTVVDRVVKKLKEDVELQKYVGGHVFAGPKRRVAPTEVPAILVTLQSKRETPVTDYPFIVRVDLSLLITGFLEVFDFERSEWIGTQAGKGIGDLDQDIRKALEGDLNLNGKADFFTFGETGYSDEYPIRGVQIPMQIVFKEEMRDRVRSSP